VRYGLTGLTVQPSSMYQYVSLLQVASLSSFHEREIQLQARDLQGNKYHDAAC
jgi:hypothetical protein